MNIFISYSRSDEEAVKQIVEDCKSLGYQVWFDKELSGGQAWWDRILTEIRECNLFLFVLSRKSNNSTACGREYNYAHRLNKRILPVLVDEVSTNLLPVELTTIQYVDYRKKDRSSVIGLVKALNGLPSEQPLPDPLPDPPEVPISYLGNLKAEIESSGLLSFEDQSAILLKLKDRLKNQDEASDVYELLEKFKRRDELYHRIAQQIDELLAGRQNTANGGQTSSSGGATTRTEARSRPRVTQQKAYGTSAPPRIKQHRRPRPQQDSRGKQWDWVSIVAFIAAFIVGPIGIGMAIWGLIRVSQNSQELKGSGWAWAAIGVGAINTLILLENSLYTSSMYPYGY